MSHETPSYTLEEEEKERAKKSREKSKQELQAKLAGPKRPDLKALAAVKQLDQEHLEALRQKLAGIEVPNGTEEIPLSEEDLEEIR